MSTFVTIGNATQAFGRLLRAVESVAAELPQPVLVQRGHTAFDCVHCDVVEFLEMEAFQRLITGSTLVIAHAGAGVVIQALQAGRVPVVMARRAVYGEHVDDHQLDFAQELAQLGRLVLVTDGGMLKQGVARALELQRFRVDQTLHQPIISLLRDRLARYAGRFENKPT